MFKVENSYYDDTLVLVKTNSYQKTVEYQFNNSQSKKVKYADNTAYGNAVNEVGKKFVEVKKDVWYKIDSIVQVRKNALSLIFLVNGLGNVTKTYANSTALNAEISKLDPYFISIDGVYYKGTTLHVASVDAQTLSIHFQFDNGNEKVETYANSTALNAALAKLTELGEGGGGESEISDNTASTIDVSTYNDPVEITPGEGYDATKKVTVTLSNIPTAGATLYAWKLDTAIVYTSTSEPTTSDKALVPASTGLSESAIAAVGESFASITISSDEYARYDTGDISITN